MRVLIVQSVPELAELWAKHLRRGGAEVEIADSQDRAVAVLSTSDIQVIILSLALQKGSALAIADYASYRRPDAKVIFVSNANFFSDGSIFNHCANARALVPTGTAPDDLAAMVAHYGGIRQAG